MPHRPRLCRAPGGGGCLPPPALPSVSFQRDAGSVSCPFPHGAWMNCVIFLKSGRSVSIALVFIISSTAGLRLEGISRSFQVELPQRGRIHVAADRCLPCPLLALTISLLSAAVYPFPFLSSIRVFCSFLRESGIFGSHSHQFCALSLGNIWILTFFKQVIRVYLISKTTLWRQDLSIKCCFSLKPLQLISVQGGTVSAFDACI